MANRKPKMNTQGKFNQNKLQMAGNQLIRGRRRKPKVEEAPDAYAVPGAQHTVDRSGNDYYKRPGKTTVKFGSSTNRSFQPVNRPAPSPSENKLQANRNEAEVNRRAGTQSSLTGAIKRTPKKRRKRPMYGGSKKPLVIYED